MAIVFKSLQVLRESGKQKLFVVPYFFTFANALFGFLAVIKTFEHNFVAAAYCIMFAWLMDIFDGKSARMLGFTSSIGMELDSLCDAVSFCFAPVILLYIWRFNEFGVLGVAALAFYLCAGLLRLARFNSVGQADEQDIDYFVGLPTPSVALLVTQLIVHHQWISLHMFQWLHGRIGLILFVAIVAWLMISNVRFPTFKRAKPKYLLLAVFFLILFFLLSFLQPLPFFFLFFLAYASGGLIVHVYSLLHRQL